jgi:RluA family pseudouridine synthase
VVPAKDAGTRLDRYLAGRFTYRSRTGWVEKIRQGKILVDGRRARPSHVLRSGALIEDKAPPLPEPPVDTDCPILYEDDSLVAVNKSGNIPVHPSGRYFRNSLLHHLGRGRAESDWLRIVHRIDRETSGVLVLAKSLSAARRLTRQFEDRLVGKVYLAVARGYLAEETVIDQPLGHDPRFRIRKAMRVVPGGRPSETLVKPLARGRGVTLVEARPRTGRLHQIRAHLRSAGHPVLGDKMYGPDEAIFFRFVKGPLTDEDYASLGFRRQALHAWKITLAHPETNRPMEITAHPPADFLWLLENRGLSAGTLDGPGASPVRWLRG